jgi:hypothetical protein
MSWWPKKSLISQLLIFINLLLFFVFQRLLILSTIFKQTFARVAILGNSRGHYLIVGVKFQLKFLALNLFVHGFVLEVTWFLFL